MQNGYYCCMRFFICLTHRFFSWNFGGKDGGIIGQIWKKLSPDFLTITWPMLVHLAWQKACFINHRKEGYKMICSEICKTHRLPMPNPSNNINCSNLNMLNSHSRATYLTALAWPANFESPSCQKPGQNTITSISARNCTGAPNTEVPQSFYSFLNTHYSHYRLQHQRNWQ